MPDDGKKRVFILYLPHFFLSWFAALPIEPARAECILTANNNTNIFFCFLHGAQCDGIEWY